MSIKLQKSPLLHVCAEKIFSSNDIGPKLLYMNSLDPREHVTYPQHLVVCNRNDSNAISSKFSKISKSIFEQPSLECHNTVQSWVVQNGCSKILFEILLNLLEMALESFLLHTTRCCGYVSCSLGPREFM